MFMFETTLNILLLIQYLMYIYIFAIILIIYLILCATIRIKMRFWHLQPVFHIYNLRYWLKPPGFIELNPPEVNKYVNLINNKLIVLPIEGLDILLKKGLKEPKDLAIKGLKEPKELSPKICNFIRDYYIIHKFAKYKPTDDDILAYLQCANNPAFFNIYQETRLLFENGVPTGTIDEEIIGVMSARQLNVTLFANKKNRVKFPVYYVDHLCVKPIHRKKNIAPQMIQTMYYNVARNNKKVNAYMFKREGQMTAIVPLVFFQTYSFDLTQWRPEYILEGEMSVLQINSPQMNLFVQFIQEQTSKFECVILPDISSLIHLIKMEKIFIYGVLFRGELIAIYVFRPLELYYGLDNKKTAECIAILAGKNENDTIIAGFSMSLQKLQTQRKVDILLIEETAQGKCVIDSFLSNPLVVLNFKNPTAFFLYNYASYSVKNSKTLLIY